MEEDDGRRHSKESGRCMLPVRGPQVAGRPREERDARGETSSGRGSRGAVLGSIRAGGQLLGTARRRRVRPA